MKSGIIFLIFLLLTHSISGRVTLRKLNDPGTDQPAQEGEQAGGNEAPSNGSDQQRGEGGQPAGEEPGQDQEPQGGEGEDWSPDNTEDQNEEYQEGEDQGGEQNQDKQNTENSGTGEGSVQGGSGDEEPAEEEPGEEEPGEEEPAEEEPAEEEPAEEEPFEEEPAEEEPAEVEPEPLEEVPEEISMDENTEDELERNFRKISNDLKTYEDAYKLCIDAIKDVHYDVDTVTACTGENYNLLIDDIWYIKRKLIAQSESTLRRRFVGHCYQKAQGNLETSDTCDLIEKDTVKMLRHEIDFPLMLNLNRKKYEEMYGKIDPDLFDELLRGISPVYQELNTLLEELYDHKVLTLASLKKYIDDRTSKVKAKYTGGDINTKPKLKRTKMVITSTLNHPPHYYINLDRLPRPVMLNGNPKTYAVKTNPYVEKWINNVGPQRFSEVNNPVEPIRNWDPNIDVGYGKDDYRGKRLKGI